MELIAAALALFTLASVYGAHRVTRRLMNLRANCYLTDKDGVRRRYAKASPDVRARAEAGQ